MKIQDLESLEEHEETDLEFEEEKIIEELSKATKILKNKVSWTKNVGIKNKYSEKQRFLESWEEEKSFRPDFKFKKFESDGEKLVQVIDQCRDATELISAEDLEKYGAESIDADDMQRFFDEIFRQFRLFAEIGLNIEDEAEWRALCEKVWPMADEEKIDRSRNKAREIETRELEKNLVAEDVKDMFEAEFQRLGVEYDVEIREVGGCFNIPEEQKLVVAKGDGEIRKFSRKEAEMLTMHEVFHSIRAYNGYKAGEKSGFPDILGIHTPFYDQTEEGGAIYREHRTDTSYANKRFNYHLMRVAAYEVYSSEDYVKEFQDIVEELVDCGATPGRAFTLAARNREILRHHIYQTGYENWKRKEEIWPLLIGKINEEWAEKFKEEVEADGMLQRPEVNEKQLFDFRFKDSS